jgi:hypothetical protein
MQSSNNKYSKDIPQPKVDDEPYISPIRYEKSYNTIDVAPHSYEMGKERSESLSNRPNNSDPQPAPTPNSHYKQNFNA